MTRLIQPEILDTLPPDNPRARHSRRDLHRINAWMRHHVIMARALEKNWAGPAPRQITELGAGDGAFLFSVANKIKARWPNMNGTLLDWQNNVRAKTLADFAALGWRMKAVVTDVFDWSPKAGDIEVANLFLHHFTEEQLGELFRKISRRATLFVALEPRRSAWPLFCSRLLWGIGCNDVTRHDAAVSVRAGFTGRELSALWPDRQQWQLTEQSVGAFSHLFVARRTY